MCQKKNIYLHIDGDQVSLAFVGEQTFYGGRNSAGGVKTWVIFLRIGDLSVEILDGDTPEIRLRCEYGILERKLSGEFLLFDQEIVSQSLELDVVVA